MSIYCCSLEVSLMAMFLSHRFWMSAFNGYIGGWNVERVTDMTNMWDFSGGHLVLACYSCDCLWHSHTSHHQPLITPCRFTNTPFTDGGIGGWNVQRVTSMQEMWVENFWISVWPLSVALLLVTNPSAFLFLMEQVSRFWFFWRH